MVIFADQARDAEDAFQQMGSGNKVQEHENTGQSYSDWQFHTSIPPLELWLSRWTILGNLS